ncbi:3-methyladenine DNA glycosylase AlkD [Paenibacillus methanolicus]|uniref:3-methyladenine DNA glycosylase AlkD n=1 Tax=Paenibacillus methanolicus TaxID=582686 RepID=A0A5S5CJK2_9BACL|nr:3-methyladenine DNA glycosylase AlkD [Paenibacillus methanolicus]
MDANSWIRQQLSDAAEDRYRLFASSLIPNIDNVLGVRLPALRKLAAKLAKDDWRAYLDEATDEYFEETMLQGMVIAQLDADFPEWQTRIAAFVPKINNWSICDSFCNDLKRTKRHLTDMWSFIAPYFASNEPYKLRFGVVMLLHYYLTDDYINRVLALLDAVEHPDYYVKMAVAWAVSISYVKQPDATLAYLRENRLDDFTYSKSLQKITESRQVDAAEKAMIRGMKRK